MSILRTMLGFTIIGLSIGSVAGALLLIPIIRSKLQRAAGSASQVDISAAPKISVVIPARNEGKRLPILLASLSAQLLAPLEIIVADDQSEDDTANVARSAGARVVEVPERPKEWLGKPWAVHTGAAAADGELLLFLDADVVLEPDALAVLVAAYQAKQVPYDDRGPVISAQPYHRTHRLHERLSLFFNVQVFVGAAHRSHGLRLALEGSCCYGPCILCSRTAYEAIGGHEAVRDCVLEDIELGRRFKAAGIAVFGYSGQGVLEFRMYPDGPGQMIDGFSKNMLLGAMRANAWFFFLDVFWICGLVAAPALVGIAAAIGYPMELVVAGSFYVILALQTWIAASKLGSFGAPVALLYPLPLLVFLYVAARVIVFAITGRKIQWKGRAVSPRATKS